jgi:hypothetical protein
VFIRRWPVVIGLIAVMMAVTVSSAKDAAATRLTFPPGLVEAHRIKAEELLTSTQKLLPKGAFLGPLLDDHYSVISYDWLKREFIPYYRNAVDTLKLFASRDAEGSDCDDFSMYLRHMISLAGFVGQSAEPAAAQMIVFQEKRFSGVSGTHERHEVGLFLTDRGWFVLEPQNAAELLPLERYANARDIQYISFH